MYNNPFWFIPPFLPPDNNEPPTVYSLLESIVNYGKQDKTKIVDLAKEGRSSIFDFSYPLTDKISKEQFETMILNYYMMRRIGYETLTAFKIQLNVKLNMIMPKYNMMFDSIANWDLFKDGRTITRAIEKNEKGSNVNTNESNTENVSSSSASNSGSGTSSDNRKRSDLPQSELTNLDDNKYVSEYERNNGTTSNQATSTESASNTSESTGSSNNNYQSDSNVNEVTKYSQNDLVKLYEEFQNNLNHIYGLIFKDLDSLFYSLI